MGMDDNLEKCIQMLDDIEKLGLMYAERKGFRAGLYYNVRSPIQQSLNSAPTHSRS